MRDGRIIDFEELQCLLVKDPHGGGIAIENQPVLFLAFTQSRLGPLAVRDIARVNHDCPDLRVCEPILSDCLKIAPGAVQMTTAKFPRKRALRVRVRHAILEPLGQLRHIVGMQV